MTTHTLPADRSSEDVPHFLHELCRRCGAYLTPEQRAAGHTTCPHGCRGNAWVTEATDVPKIGSGPWGTREPWQ